MYLKIGCLLAVRMETDISFLSLGFAAALVPCFAVFAVSLIRIHSCCIRQTSFGNVCICSPSLLIFFRSESGEQNFMIFFNITI